MVGISVPTQSGAAFSIHPGAQLMRPVSVDPYPEDTEPLRWGNRSSIWRVTSGGVADPPTPTPLIWVGSMVSMSGCCNSFTTWVMPPPRYETFSSRVSASTPSGSKRPSGQTLVLPLMTVDTAIDIPDTWNNG